jgi:hypothetical protein
MRNSDDDPTLIHHLEGDFYLDRWYRVVKVGETPPTAPEAHRMWHMTQVYRDMAGLPPLPTKRTKR